MFLEACAREVCVLLTYSYRVISVCWLVVHVMRGVWVCMLARVDLRCLNASLIDQDPATWD